MMKSIGNVMTKMPHSVGADIDYKTIHEQMQKLQVRHLPVRSGGKLVGVISDRDLKLAASFGNIEQLTAEDIMTPDPYQVNESVDLKKVVSHMYEHKLGCALIVKDDSLVGIFTITDCLRILNNLL